MNTAVYFKDSDVKVIIFGSKISGRFYRCDKIKKYFNILKYNIIILF